MISREARRGFAQMLGADPKILGESDTPAQTQEEAAAAMEARMEAFRRANQAR
jgi:hypothetical protein